MDLSQFEELERRVMGLIDRQQKLSSENSELRQRLMTLENQFEKTRAENEQLQAQQETLLINQRDVQKEELIRSKVADLLEKLEGI